MPHKLNSKFLLIKDSERKKLFHNTRSRALDGSIAQTKINYIHIYAASSDACM